MIPAFIADRENRKRRGEFDTENRAGMTDGAYYDRHDFDIDDDEDEDERQDADENVRSAAESLGVCRGDEHGKTPETTVRSSRIAAA